MVNFPLGYKVMALDIMEMDYFTLYTEVFEGYKAKTLISDWLSE